MFSVHYEPTFRIERNMIIIKMCLITIFRFRLHFGRKKNQEFISPKNKIK